MRVCVLDMETSISNTVHGPAAKYPANDFYTVIWGYTPDYIMLDHCITGWTNLLSWRFLDEVECIIGSNLPFDLAYFKRDEKEFKKYLFRGGWFWDLQIFEYLITGQRHTYASLGDMQQKYLGTKVKKDRISKLYKKGIGADEIMKAKFRCPRIWKLYCEYCVDDGKTTLQIFSKQYKIAKEKGMLPLIKTYNLFMCCLVLIQGTGIKINLDGSQKTLKEFRLRKLELLQKASKIINKFWTDERLPEFNINSPQHKSAILFGGNIVCEYKIPDGQYKNGKDKFKKIKEDVYIKGFQLGEDFRELTKVEGRYATGAPIISKILSSPQSEELINYCKLQKEAMIYHKMASTYLEPFLNYSIEGIYYPKFNNVSVITGRLSSGGSGGHFNSQNVPSKGIMCKPIQGQFIAPKDWICMAADYAQLEIYIAAWNSRDDKLIADILNGLDFHCQSLSFAENIPYEEVYKKCMVDKLPEWQSKRTKAKPITFQKAYGAMPKSVSKSTGLDLKIVEKIFEELDKKYWKLKAFNDYVYEKASNNMYSSSKWDFPLKLSEYREKPTKDGRRFNSSNMEYLPVQIGNDKIWKKELTRNVGYYIMPHKKIYAFEEYAQWNEYRGNIRRGIAPTQTKDYPAQGGAADVMNATSIELMFYVLKNSDEIKYLSQIHDSNWFYIKKNNNMHKHIVEIKHIMEDVDSAVKKHLRVDVGFPFKVEVKIGDNFAETEIYEIGENNG